MLVNNVLHLVFSYDVFWILFWRFFFNDGNNYATRLAANHNLSHLVTSLNLTVQVFLIFFGVSTNIYRKLAFSVELEFLERIPKLSKISDFVMVCNFINIALIKAY
jgi:hypothetical protein